MRTTSKTATDTDVKTGTPAGTGDGDFSREQRKYLQVLVSTWIFGALWYGIGKYVIPWQPESWNTVADRLELVARDAVFALIPMILMICVVAAQRLNPRHMVGHLIRPNTPVDINTRCVANTAEQFVLFFIAQVGLVINAPPHEAVVLPVLTALFILGRFLFWWGYHNNQLVRAFGFGITFYPTLMALVWLLLRFTLGVEII